MPLALLVGPANAGKVSRLLDRYLENLDREPYLVVPNRAEVDRVERDLLARRPVLLGGDIGTFDDLFDWIARAGTEPRKVATDAQRALILRRALAGASLNGLGASARFSGFGDTLLGAISELESGSSSRPTSATTSPSSTPPTGASSTGWSSTIATSSAPARLSASRVSSTPGTAARCSPMASRI